MTATTAEPIGAAAPMAPTLGGRVRRLLFGVPPRETDLDRRGFRVDSAAARARFTTVVESFLAGYHGAIEDAEPARLAARLATLDAECRGFAFEGAGMGLWMLDAMSLSGGRRLRRFLDGPGDPHEYMIYVGVGWAIARLGGWQRRLDRLPPMRRHLAADGLGFHEAFFRTAATVDAQAEPRRLSGYARRGFDQGVGRCLWFVEGASPRRVQATINRFAASRHPDLWAGVGLACTYAGASSTEDLAAVKAAAGPHAAHLAQGSAFAALARGRAQNPSPHCDVACEVLWGRPALWVYEVARAAEAEAPTGEGEPPGYEVMRARIRERFAAEAAR